MLFKKPRLYPADQAGLTLVEVLIGLVLLAILGGLAVPSFSDYLERQRIKMAAERLAESLNLARAEALAQQQFMYVQLSGQGTDRWCYAVSAEPKCDCLAGCQGLQQADSRPLKGVLLSGSSRSVFRFNWKNGSATGANGTAIFVGQRTGQRACVVLSNLGRVRITTSKQNPLAGYPADAGCQ